MKLTILGIITIAAAAAFALQTSSAQTPAEVKVRGCLAGNGSDASPWILRAAVLPTPPAAAPAGPPAGGGRGGGAPGGGRGGAGGGRGGDGARGAAPAAPAPAAQTQPPVDLKLTGVDMTPWRNMFVEIE